MIYHLKLNERLKVIALCKFPRLDLFVRLIKDKFLILSQNFEESHGGLVEFGGLKQSSVELFDLFSTISLQLSIQSFRKL